DAGVHRDADALLGHDRGPDRTDRQHLEEPVAGPTPDEHVVRAVAQGDRDGDHCTSATTRSTTSSTVKSSTSTMTSATASYIDRRSSARRTRAVAASPVRSGRPAPLPT